ncbi:helix-turn-helix domain-containing protein [Streptomyces sp. NPDC052396]|uniref:helix-turn-helix domain-containing protein n=1 Tax=Streptomyces sp. NPDC052396 TaxID=3365689 RepID=UPI0037CF8F76
MSSSEDEACRRTERARQAGLFRYSLVQALMDPALTTRQRGKLARELAGREHTDLSGRRVRISRATIDRWTRAYRKGGFAALVPEPRRAVPRTPAEVLELAIALKRENPSRTAAQVQQILRTVHGWSPTDRTLQRHFAAAGLAVSRPRKSGPSARHDTPGGNERWTGIACPGPKIRGRDTRLFAFIDDHSRAVVGYRFGYAEDPLRLAGALRPALAAYGVPESIQVPNGPAPLDIWLLKACVTLTIRLAHARPARPCEHGSGESSSRLLCERFLAGLSGHVAQAVVHPAELNRVFAAWVESVYHRTAHPETGQPPIERWLASIGKPARLPSPADLREAFLRSQTKTVTKEATISFHGNTYEVDPALTGMQVKVSYNPFDLNDVELRAFGQDLGDMVHRPGDYRKMKRLPGNRRL